MFPAKSFIIFVLTAVTLSLSLYTSLAGALPVVGPRNGDDEFPWMPINYVTPVDTHSGGVAGNRWAIAGNRAGGKS